MDTLLSTEEPTRQKPGPKKGSQKKASQTLDELITRVCSLEQLVTRMAHQVGFSPQIIKEAGLEPFNPSKKDMYKRMG